jgi:hypothetical protein
MNDPANPLGGDVWRRGAKLGLQWVAVFFAVTLIVYLIMGVTGWSGAARALCAMGLGPIIGIGVIVVWGLIRRPALLPREEGKHDPGKH